VAVAGAGAFGRNHLRVLRNLETEEAGVALVAAVELDPARADEVAKQYGIPVFASVDALLKTDLKLDAACVAVPTVSHYEVASQLLGAGLDLLIEKPLAATLAEADALIQSQEKHHRIIQPGHLERFNPAVLAVEPKLTRPMFFEAHRLSVFTPRALDVDVVLDLMIHDLDIVLTFAKSPVREVRAVGLPVISPKVDIANVRVEFESGCVANFTASRVSTERVRKLRFFEPRQYVSIDYARRDALVIQIDEAVSCPADLVQKSAPPQVAQAAAQFLSTGKLDAATIQALLGSGQIPAGLMMKILGAKNNPEKLKEIAQGLAGPLPEQHAEPRVEQRIEQHGGAVIDPHSGPAPGLSFVKPEVTPGEPLKLELLSFIDSVRTRRPPKVTARQGRAALELALTIQAQMAAHAERAGLTDFFKSSL
jgi:predicted dehydrogenase